MSDGMTIIIGDDGKARAYDDTYDITIHCESKEEQDEVKRRLMSERKTGKWVAVGECYVKCSECGLETTKNELRGIALFGENEPYFCPNCGADMREENES